MASRWGASVLYILRRMPYLRKSPKASTCETASTRDAGHAARDNIRTRSGRLPGPARHFLGNGTGVETKLVHVNGKLDPLRHEGISRASTRLNTQFYFCVLPAGGWKKGKLTGR